MNVVVSQALATGLPVIATRHSGLPEQVVDGENGFLVEEGDYEALAERIFALSNDPRLLAQFGTAGRDHVREHYSADTLNEHQVDLYVELVAQGSLRR